MLRRKRSSAFGHAFKETVCVVEHRDCVRCLLRRRCAYPYIFDSDFLPYSLYIFEQLGERRGIGRGRGRFAVESAVWPAPDGREVPIYRGDDKVLHSAPHPVTVQDLGIPEGAVDRVTVTFLTPARIVFGEHLAFALDVHVVIRTPLRRVSNLA